MNSYEAKQKLLQELSKGDKASDEVILQLLKDGSLDPAQINLYYQDENLIGWVAKNGRLNLMDQLFTTYSTLSPNDSFGFEKKAPLHHAISHGHSDLVRYLIKLGANTNAPSHYGYTPAHLAVMEGSLILLTLLRDSGADLFVADDSGNTLLHLAVEFSHVSLVRHLLHECNFDVNGTNSQGWTPAHTAALGSKKHRKTRSRIKKKNNTSEDAERILVMLAEKGCDFSRRTKLSQLPLHIAAWAGNLAAVKWFISRVENLENSAGNLPDGWGNTPLHLAASQGHVDLVSWLVEMAGGDFSCKNRDGATPFHEACRGGHLLVTKYFLKKSPRVREFVSDSAQSMVLAFWTRVVNLPDSSGNTPLHLAARLPSSERARQDAQGSAGIPLQRVQLLLWLQKHGGDFLRKNEDGVTPAALLGDPNLVGFLRDIVSPREQKIVISPEIIKSRETRSPSNQNTTRSYSMMEMAMIRRNNSSEDIMGLVGGSGFNNLGDRMWRIQNLYSKSLIALILSLICYLLLISTVMIFVPILWAR
eukprot:TRINITY_DN17699_c0_g1_i1.p1 TRINITY_DN17699_c0_g1~~TRINITY_DN17699_c0_g1_i1.p1  ORF type:complete len:532 (+),score=80.45 TRINITY_DN17699_c0_g1_i1:77-1672(+)